MPMFKLSIALRWALMAARDLARLSFDRRRDLINDRANRANAAEAPLDGAQESYHFDKHTTLTCGAYQHGEAALHTCIALYFFAYYLATPLGDSRKFEKCSSNIPLRRKNSTRNSGVFVQ
jgi:hypothetical protein